MDNLAVPDEVGRPDGPPDAPPCYLAVELDYFQVAYCDCFMWGYPLSTG